MGYKASTLAVATTATIHLKDADGNLLWFTPEGADAETGKQPVTVTVYGPGSREHAQATARRSNHNIERLRKKGKSDLSADDLAREGADFLTAVTKGFENFDYPDDQPITSDKQIHALYSDRTLGFIADQVNEYLGDWANFTKGSAKS